MYGYIYKTTNIINGKIYIGQHKATKFDPTYFGSGKHFLNALKKYGVDSFSCEILEWCETQSLANSRERFWIAYYNAKDRSVGYNITDGGEGWKGAHHSKETREKISRAKTGSHPKRVYIVSDETRKKISSTLKAKNQSSWNKGIPCRDETREKIRKALLGKKLPIEVIEKMRKKTPWNKGIPMTEEAKKHLKEVNLGKRVKRRTVGQFDKQTGELLGTYISCTDASIAIGKERVGHSKISCCCNGTRKTAYGYVWRYLD